MNIYILYAPEDEFAVIVAQQPRFVVIDNPQHPLLEAYLRNACHLVSKYEGNFSCSLA